MRDFLHNLHAARLISVALILMLLAGVIAPFSALDDMDSADGGEETPEYVIFDGEYLKNDTVSDPKQGGFSYESENGFSFLRFTPAWEKVIDPSVTFSPKEYYSANEYKYISVIIRATGIVNADSGFSIYYVAGEPGDFSGSDIVGGSYSKISGWQIVTFNLSTKSSWQGQIHKLRVDMFGAKVEGVADIAAIIFSKTPTAVYDSAFDALTSMFPPVQTVSDFSADEIDTIITNKKGEKINNNTAVNVRDGNLLFEGTGVYRDPYVNFMYKALMKKRGADTILKTADFERTVIRYRTGNLGSSAGMELFVYTGNEYAPFQPNGTGTPHFSVSKTYKPSTANQWRCISFTMNPDSFKSVWSGDFNGFRIDWAGTADVLSYMEISDVMFYENDADAASVTGALNTLNLALPEEQLVLHPFLEMPSALNGAVMMTAGSLYGKLKGATGLKVSHYGQIYKIDAEDSDVENPYVDMDVTSVDLYKHRYISVLIKRKGTNFEKFDLYYKNNNGEYVKGDYTSAQYASISGWQVLTFMLDDTALNGSAIESLRLDFTGGAACSKGSGCDISAITFSDSANTAYDAAYQMLTRVYVPVQIWDDFTANDAKSFGGGSSGGYTSVTADGGNLTYTATATAGDPGKMFNYTNYVKSAGIAEVTTEDFRYTVIRYRSAGISAIDTRMQLFLVTGDATGIHEMLRKDSESGKQYHSTTVGYKDSATWTSMILDMAQTDDKKDNNVLMRGWQGRGKFTGYRVDWCSDATAGSFMQISDFILYKDANDARAMNEALCAVSVPIPVIVPPEDIFPEDTESEATDATEGELPLETESETLPELPPLETTEDTLPSFEETTEDTLPSFEETTEDTLPSFEETTGETMPSFEETTEETLPEISDTHDTDESESMPELTESESVEDTVDTEPESESTENTEADETTEETTDESLTESSESAESSDITTEESTETESSAEDETEGSETESVAPSETDTEEGSGESGPVGGGDGGTGEGDSSGGNGSGSGDGSGDLPTDFEDETEAIEAEGSKMPFYIACGALTMLSIASIVAVAVIKSIFI